MDKAKFEAALHNVRTSWLKLGSQLEDLEAMLKAESTPGQVAKQCLDHFAKTWEARYRTKLIIASYPGAIVQLKTLLKAMTADELTAAMTRYLSSNEPFYASARHGLPMFIKCINKFTAAADDGGSFLEAAPADCRHMPACRTDVEHTRKRARERNGVQA